jgi:hypothetical protein
MPKTHVFSVPLAGKGDILCEDEMESLKEHASKSHPMVSSGLRMFDIWV